jgi:hypothetical protein
MSSMQERDGVAVSSLHRGMQKEPSSSPRILAQSFFWHLAPSRGIVDALTISTWNWKSSSLLDC